MPPNDLILAIERSRGKRNGGRPGWPVIEVQNEIIVVSIIVVILVVYVACRRRVVVVVSVVSSSSSSLSLSSSVS
jgi:hypothetical protein